MKFNSFAFIFLMPGFDPKTNISTMEKEGFCFKAVGIDMNHKEQAIEVARQLHREGYQMIELCGGFGPNWISKIEEALGNSIPVGGVFYGPEFRKSLVNLSL
ncbi:DUF6506 family protein [Coxiella burnetii]|uniref:DUF6506 family protein n=1 Tax=Coxiella burnetii TaxID=777 RepID=UPI0028FC1052|nr:DUF6506 family protein [Coxiella burnetii]